MYCLSPNNVKNGQLIELVYNISSNLDKLGIPDLLFLTFCSVDLFAGFYRGISPGATGSFATGATYLESTKTWMEHANPNLRGHWSHFIAGGIGEKLCFYVYCFLFPKNLHDAV